MPRRENAFPAIKRVKLQSEFQAVFRFGTVATDATLVVHALRSEGHTRLGISISKKVGSAPQRNRWKRLIREAFRLNQHSLPPNLLIVVRPRKDAVPNLHFIQNSLRDLCRRLDSRPLKRLSDQGH